MDRRHLQYYVALAEELHFGRAALRLGIATPTLSVQIQEIERRLGTPLFDRSRREVTLTSAGAIFLAEARNVLRQFEQAEAVGRRAGRGEIGRIEIGYVGSAVHAGALQAQHQGIQGPAQRRIALGRLLAANHLAHLIKTTQGLSRERQT